MKAACEGEDATLRLGRDGLSSVSPEDGQPHTIRNGLICAFVVAACLWASYPVAEIGINDDWTYTKTAQVFAQTGHIIYNAWDGPMLGWQVVWGALFIKLFGFSFTVVRLSMLPVAMATAFLFHAILVRFGVNARNAVLGSLTLGLSPLFLPLAASYMTDLPGLFVVLLCLYLCQRAVAASSSRVALAWLCLAAATNVVGGTVRQIAWLGALVMVPSAGWLLRRRRKVLLTSSVLWGFSVASIFACMRWFARQPNSMPEPIFKGTSFSPVPVIEILHLVLQISGSLLCLALLVFPILVAWLPEARSFSRSTLLRIALIVFALALFQQLVSSWTIPWLPNVIDYEFAAPKIDIFLKLPTPFLPIWELEALSLLVVATALISVVHLWNRIKDKTTDVDLWQNMLWLLGPFSLCYFVLLLPHAYRQVILDRYLLPIQPVVIACLLRLRQKRISPTLPAISVIVLAVFALCAIAGTHDWFECSRARLVAINEIRALGVPRTDIQGGAEYDGWTQIEAAGSMKGSPFLSDARQQRSPLSECNYPFARYTPDIHPNFTTIFPKMQCLKPSKYPPVSYRTWLPPYHGTILVQEIPNASN